ncbi:MAG: DUF1501 domain-containing protein, partial [Planctomycetales bacterium]|nr:DUF1501 domain-containing protein [Planctomycetales bacterium]
MTGLPSTAAASAPAPRTRREFLQQLAAATAATWASSAPRAWAVEGDAAAPPPRADACILLWMAGGMAAPDTFDPKAYLPFEKGLSVDRILSTFPAIATSVDGLKISAGLERVAQVMDRATLVRSHVQPDLGNILHSRHQYHWHTGYVPPQTVAAPHLGAWLARVLGPINPVIPPFINIGQQLEGNGESEELKAFTTGGFFGSEFGPFNLPRAAEAISAVQPPAGMSRTRFAERYDHFRRLLASSPRREFVSDYHQESMLRSIENAQRLLASPDRVAFDISREPSESFDRYAVS